MDAAAETVSAIIAAKIIPCTLEFLDRKTIQCVEAYAHVGLPLDAEAVLLIEADGHPAAVADEAAKIEELARAHGATHVRRARDTAEAVQLATARRSAFSALARLKPTTILEDATVPRSELAKMIRFIADVAIRHRLEIATLRSFRRWQFAPDLSHQRARYRRNAPGGTGDEGDLRICAEPRRHDYRRAWGRPGQKKPFCHSNSATRVSLCSKASSARSIPMDSSIPEKSSTDVR